MPARLLALLAPLTLAVALAAQEASPRWWRGNLHTHTLWSDGNELPELVADWYRANGYHFLALSDHNILADHDKWLAVDQVIARGGRSSLPRAKGRFGADWVETRTNEQGKVEVRLKKLAELRKVLEAPGEFLLIPATEITDAFDSRPIHINASNVQAAIQPKHGDSAAATIRNNLRAVAEHAAAAGQPVLAHLNHPNYRYAISAEDLAEVLEDKFFEVFNGHPDVRQLGDEQHAGVERMWDIANTLRLAEHGAAPLYGIATDDSHNYHNAAGSISGRGWVMVLADSLTAKDLIAAMHAGRFYASTGVTLSAVEFDGKTLTVAVEPQVGAEYRVEFLGTRRGVDTRGEPVRDAEGRELRATKRYSAEIGTTFASSKGVRASYTLSGDELYVRAVITSSLVHERPSYAGQQQQAWTQPVGFVARAK